MPENFPIQKKTANVPREELQSRQQWLPHVKPGIMQPDEELRQLTGGAARYNLPFSFREKLNLELQKRIYEIYGIEDSVVFKDATNPVPLHWRPIVHYLCEAGLIAQPTIDFEIFFNDEPKIYSTRLRSSSVQELTDGGGEPMGGDFSRGVSRDLDEAISKVIGELLERYPLTLYREKELFRASVESLESKGLNFLNPYFLAQCSEEQKRKYPDRRFDKKSVFRWVKGTSLAAGKDAFIPAQLVFWNYRSSPSEPVVRHPITNGAGGMFTLTEAILAGLYELIQRDAFFVYWFNKIAPPRIDHNSLKGEKLQELVRDIERYGLRLEILDITSDFKIPAFVAALIDDSGKGQAFSLGGGCGQNPEAAITRAITEAMGVRHWLRLFGNEYPSLPDNYEPFSVPLGQAERLRLWGNPSMRKSADFFLSGPLAPLYEKHKQVAVFSDCEKELSYLVDLFKSRGDEYEIFYYEAKHPVLRELGYHSAAVSVPALLPLYLYETFAPLGAERIQSACRALNYQPSPDINPLPHPFP